MCSGCGYLEYCEWREGWGRHKPTALCEKCGGIDIETPQASSVKSVRRLRAVTSKERFIEAMAVVFPLPVTSNELDAILRREPASETKPKPRERREWPIQFRRVGN
jgi:hypothetical protein